MDKPLRIQKDAAEMLSDCETHIFFLSEAQQKYLQGEPDRYKQIVAELRVLVCEWGKNRALLLNLMDQYGFTYEVQPSNELPFANRPIELVDWQTDPVMQQIREEAASAKTKEDHARILALQKSLRRSMSFREYTDRALAVFIAPYNYCYRDLILALAQQTGSSHEDPDIDLPIHQMRQFVIGGHRGHFASLVGYTDRTITVGKAFISFVETNNGYTPRHFQQTKRSA